MSTSEAIKQTTTRIVYQNKWMKVREDEVVFPNGHQGIYGVVDKPDFVLIIPVHNDGKIQLVQQYRYPVGGRYWEAPQGSWETHPTANPIEVALAELAEETGFRAESLEKFGHFFEAYGFSNQGFNLFIARQLSSVETEKDIEEQGMKTAAFAIDEIIKMIGGGIIRDAPTISAIGYLRLLSII